MKRLNAESNVYYLNKMVTFKPLNISKIHLVDDDCNEFFATVIGTNHLRGYINPEELKVIDYEEYTKEKWHAMTEYIEYERAEVR